MRATIDLDDPTDMQIIKSWNELESHGDGTVYGRVSSSGTGVHLKVHGCDPETVKRLRQICGDDERRRHIDGETELKPKQILFSSKPNGEAGEWTTDIDRVLAEYRRRCPRGIRYPDAPVRR
jgi:hypothetical protein